MATEKTRYSDAELEEFKQIILEKLAVAQKDYNQMMASLSGADSNGTDDTSPTYKPSAWLHASKSSSRVCRQLWCVFRTRLMVFAVRRAS